MESGMKLLLVGDGQSGEALRLSDPDSVSEAEFEHAVVEAFSRAYPQYACFLFGGTFVHPECGAKRPDLALVARDLTHWFVVEVEIASHSLEHHVLPQVRAFVYGEPQPDCVSSVANGLQLDRQRAGTLVRMIPRSVAVITNRRDEKWSVAIRALNAQMLVVSRFSSDSGMQAVEIEGELRAVQESLGFGKFSAVDRSVRFSPSTPLPRGVIEIVDQRGTATEWKVSSGTGALWVTKVRGTPSLADGLVLQLVRMRDGRLLLRASV